MLGTCRVSPKKRRLRLEIERGGSPTQVLRLWLRWTRLRSIVFKTLDPRAWTSRLKAISPSRRDDERGCRCGLALSISRDPYNCLRASVIANSQAVHPAL